MNILSGTIAQVFKVGRVTVKSVTLSASSGGASVLKLYDYNDTSADPKVIVNAVVSSDQQLHFNGIEFPAGVVVVPDANTDKFIVEYEQ